MPHFSEWSAPVPVPNVNSAFIDFGPGISPDGRSLYFGSNRPGGFGGADLWVSQRANVTDPWGPPANLGPVINTTAAELVPAFSPDGHWMFFNSDRPGGFGGLDVWASYRRHTQDDFAWTTPINLGAHINAAGLDAGASLLRLDDEDKDVDDEDRDDDDAERDGLDLLFFGSTRPGGLGLVDLYVSPRGSDGTFGPATLLAELSSPVNDQRPTIRRDGLEIFFYSSRSVSVGGNDLWVATREMPTDVWHAPQNVGAMVNSTANDFHPSISGDGRTLYFASDRPGGLGQADLYMTTRTKAQRGDGF
jgi:Tol biopolymer transport system component